ncbi:carboxypeptidase regulatory-like domain-containing protein [Vibrio vulnificus]
MRILYIFLLLIALSGCGGDGGNGGGNPPPSGNASIVTNQTPIGVGETCPNGGIQVDTGIDTNGNGQLDANEVSDSQSVCHGNDGLNSLVEFKNEPSGENCQNGGFRLESGLDLNTNKVLEENEVTSVSFICNGTGGDITNPTYPPLSDLSTISGKVSLEVANIRSAATFSSKRTEASMPTGVYLTSSCAVPNTQGLNTQRSASLESPINRPVPVELDENGHFEMSVPACSDYGLVVVDASSQSVFRDKIGVGAGEAVVLPEVLPEELLPPGETKLVVMDLAKGTPISDALVLIQPLGISTTTDLDGVAHFSDIPAGQYGVIVEHSDYAGKYIAAVVESEKLTDLRHVELNGFKGNVTGQVTAESLENYANILVYAHAADGSVYTSMTNSAGTYRFSSIPAGEGYSLKVIASEFRPAKLDNIAVIANSTVAVETLHLKRTSLNEGAISGVVRLQSRAETMDHAGIIVSVEGTDKEAVTARDGSFVLSGLVPGAYSLNYTHAEHQSVNQSLDVFKGVTSQLDPLTLPSFAGSLSGTLLHNDQSPAAAVAVRLHPSGQTVVSGQDGQFVFTDIAMGKHLLLVELPGYRAVQQEVVVLNQDEHGETVIDAPLTLIPYQFSGRVLASGKPLEGAKVVIRGGQLVGDASTETDANGEFAFARLTGGNYQLVVSKSGYGKNSLGLTLPSNDDHVLPYDIELERSYGVLSGSVNLGGNSDHSGVLVSIPSHNEPVLTDSAGAWQVSLPTGILDGGVEYSKSGFQSQTTGTQLIIEAGKILNLPLVILQPHTGNVSGTVLFDGTPVAGMTVSTLAGTQQAMTDSSGRFVLAEIPVGEQVLLIEKSGFVSANVVVQVVQGQNTDAGPIAVRARTLLAEVHNAENGTALEGVTALLVGNEGSFSALSTDDGELKFTAISAGNYQLQLAKAGYKTHSVQLVMPDVESYVLPFPLTLERLSGGVRGVATLKQTVDSSGIQVSLNNTDYHTVTDSTGNWSLKLPVGSYSDGITFTKPLYTQEQVTSTVVVNEFGWFNVPNVQLEQSAAELSFKLGAVGGCSGELKATAVAEDGSKYQLSVDQTGNVFGTLPLGTYKITAQCSNAGWETLTQTVVLEQGQDHYELPDLTLRQSYLKINSNDEVTNSRNVVLTLGNSDAVSMRVKLADGTNDSGWIPLQSPFEFVLADNDGKQTVVASFKNSLGALLNDVSDSIELDRQIAVKEFVVRGASTLGDTLVFTLDLTNETGATVSATVPGLVEQLILLDNGAGGDATAGDGIYTRAYKIDSGHEVDAYATATIVDRAGNELEVTSSNKVELVSKPVISGVEVSSNIDRGELTIEFVTNEPTTTLIRHGASADNQSTAVVISDMYNQSHKVTLSGLNGNQEVWYTLEATDQAKQKGEFTGKTKLAPGIVDDVAAYAGDREIGLIWTPSANTKVVGYNLYRSEASEDAFLKVNVDSLLTDTYHSDLAVNNDVRYFYYVTAVDRDGNESEPSKIVNATATDSLAGPTIVDGGILRQNTVYLQSRSPYQLTDNMKVDKGVRLVMLPGTELQFAAHQSDQSKNDKRYIQIAGVVQGFGTQEQPIRFVPQLKSHIEWDNQATDSNQRRLELRHAQLTNIAIPSADGLVKLDHSEVRMGWVGDGYENELHFYADEVNNSSLIETSGKVEQYEHCDWQPNPETGNDDWVCSTIPMLGNTANNTFHVTNLNNSEVKHIPDVEFGSQTGVAKYRVKLNADNVIGGRIEHAKANIQVAKGTTLVKSCIGDSYSSWTSECSETSNSRTFSNLDAVDSEISGGSLTIQNSRFDVLSQLKPYISSESGYTLTLHNNYWGSTDLNDILARTRYRAGGENRLYPVITGADFNTADGDKDGTPDYLDSDNDNDGYSDFQEDRASVFDPEFGSPVIYNPLDPNSHPGKDGLQQDTDMDGIPDDEDDDIDGDGLSNADEAEAGTDPYQADSDGDGIADGLEVELGYDPLDFNSKPLVGNAAGVVITPDMANGEGQVVIGSGTSLSACTIAAGTHIAIAGEANPSFSNCRFAGEYGNPVVITALGNDKDNESPTLSISGSDLTFVIVKDFGRRSFNLSSAVVSRSEFHLESMANMPSWSGVNISDSYVNGRDLSFSSINARHVKFGENSSNISSSTLDGVFLTRADYIDANDTSVTKSAVLGYLRSIDEVDNSIVSHPMPYWDNHTRFTNIDFFGGYSIPEDSSYFFDGVSFKSGDTYIEYDLGSPVDTEGDGIASTELCLNGSCFKVDGVANPRNTPNFPNGVRDLWDMRNIGTGVIEPGLPTTLISGEFYADAVSEANGGALAKSQYQFRADGSVKYQQLVAMVGDAEWLVVPNSQVLGYWYVAQSGQLRVQWPVGENLWIGSDLTSQESSELMFSDGTVLENALYQPPTLEQLIAEGKTQFLMVGKPLYRMGLTSDGKIYQDTIVLNIDGTVRIERRYGVADSDSWPAEATMVFEGTWKSVTGINGGLTSIEFSWDDEQWDFNQIGNVSLDANNQLSFTPVWDGMEMEQVSVEQTNQPPYSKDDLATMDKSYYRFNGVAALQDYTGQWIELTDNLIATVSANEGTLQMPVNAENGGFGFEGWLASGQFSASNSTTVYLYLDSDGNGAAEYGDQQIADAYFYGRQFGSQSEPLVARLMGETIRAEDFAGQTLYRVLDKTDGSLELMEVSLKLGGSALYKFYSANMGDTEWHYQGDDCTGLGCIPSKEDVSGSWSTTTQTMHHSRSSNSGNSYLQTLVMSHYNQEVYTVLGHEDNSDISALYLRDASYISEGTEVSATRLFKDKPLVPKSDSFTTQTMARVGISSMPDSVSYRYEPKRKLVSWSSGTKQAVEQGYTYYEYESLGLSWLYHNSGSTWSWSSNSRHLSLTYQLQPDGSGAFVTDGKVSKSYWMIDQSSYDWWIVQPDGEWPMLWHSSSFDYSSGMLQPNSSYSTGLAPEQLLASSMSKTWIRHLDGLTFQELRFEQGGQLVTETLLWKEGAWQLQGDIHTTSWSTDENGYMLTELDGQAVVVQLLTVADDAAGLWDRTNGDPQVWLAQRPSWK